MSIYVMLTLSNRLSHLVIVSFSPTRVLGCHHFIDEEAEMHWRRLNDLLSHTSDKWRETCIQVHIKSSSYHLCGGAEQPHSNRATRTASFPHCPRVACAYETRLEQAEMA